MTERLGFVGLKPQIFSLQVTHSFFLLHSLSHSLKSPVCLAFFSQPAVSQILATRFLQREENDLWGKVFRNLKCLFDWICISEEYVYRFEFFFSLSYGRAISELWVVQNLNLFLCISLVLRKWVA